MTLEDISVLFGDPVELSFEQAMSKGNDHGEQDIENKPGGDKHVEAMTVSA
jgi:hypothetical protein